MPKPRQKSQKRKATLRQINAELDRRIKALPDQYKACRTVAVRTMVVIPGPKAGVRTWDAQPMVPFGECRRLIENMIEQMVAEYDCVNER